MAVRLNRNIFYIIWQSDLNRNISFYIIWQSD